MELDRTALMARLKRLKEELIDMEETTSFNLLHSSAHIPGGQVRQDTEDLEELKKEISRIEKVLSDIPPQSK